MRLTEESLAIVQHLKDRNLIELRQDSLRSLRRDRPKTASNWSGYGPTN